MEVQTLLWILISICWTGIGTIIVLLIEKFYEPCPWGLVRFLAILSWPGIATVFLFRYKKH